jgi:amino acid adenylation domain-containing protein
VSDVEHPRYFDVVVVPADRTPAGLQDQRHPVDDRYPVDPHPHEVAYTLFTSGSSGVPKGVDVTRGNLDCMARAVADLFGIGPGVRMLQFASAAFDVSVLEVLVRLFGGGTICVCPHDARRSPERFAKFARDERIQVGVFPPALLSQMQPEVFEDLSVMAVGGEAFGADLVNDWNRPGLRFFNAYGPTETTVMSTAYACPTREWDAAPPIGKAIEGEYVVVLDTYGRPCPVGTPGELAIGGAGVAQGYLGDARLTASKFVASPFGAPGGRMYLTGDICVVHEDGNVSYLGRSDDQIKIRGYRISVLEVERALASLEGVEQSAVTVADPSATAERRMVAFVTTTTADFDHVQIRRQLAAVLPGYMIPWRIVQLPSLPMTTSEKVDRRALYRLAQSVSPRPQRLPGTLDTRAEEAAE